MSFNKNRKSRDDKSNRAQSSSRFESNKGRKFDNPHKSNSPEDKPFFHSLRNKKTKEDFRRAKRDSKNSYYSDSVRETGDRSKGSYDDRRGSRSGGRNSHKSNDSYRSRDSYRSGESFKSRDSFKSNDSHRSRDSFRSDESFKSKDSYRDRDAFKSRDSFRSKNSFRAKGFQKKSSQANIEDGLIRLNRYISNSGVCSRRKADELIEAGVISVNGKVVTELGTKVDPSKDDVRYNGERLKREKMVYILLNKPKDFITTTDDPQERKTVMQLVANATKERVYPVGRLDRNTTGLLLLTNDGKLADKLAHPRNKISKIYKVELDKALTQGDFNKIQFGLELEDGVIKPDDISYILGASKREVGIQIHSGKNRIVRRIFEHLGYEVIKLDRTVYGTLTKKDIPRGKWRFLSEMELLRLRQAAEDINH